MFLIVPLQFTLTPNLKIKSDTGVLDSDKAVCLNVYFVGQINIGSNNKSVKIKNNNKTERNVFV